ncbi:MAG: DUF4186 family protein [Acidimicrobiales bacterium]
MTTTSPPGGLAPLKISCTSSNCEADLHCFKATRKLVKENKAGACRSCGIELIDWPRLHDRSLDDVAFTFSELRRESIRHHFWHLGFDQKAINHARRKGRRALYEAAQQRIKTSVSRAGMPFDGQQTPRSGNTLYYAQHATASCCRRCIEYWHAIPPDRDLSEEEVQYLTSLVICYLDERLSDLGDDPVYVPPQRSLRRS